MKAVRRHIPLVFVLPCALIMGVGACGDSDPVSPNPEIEFLVGDWDAVRFEISPNAAPDESFDLIAEGGSFTLNIQPSGQYTVQLTVQGVPAPPEIGTIDVEGNELIIRRTNPAPETVTRAEYAELADGHVVFSGPSLLDIDGDGTAEAITLEVEIVRES